MKNKILILVSVLIIGCSKDTDTATEKFDNRKQIASITSKVIKPKVKLFSIEAKNLKNLTEQYIDNPTILNLDKVKNQWKVTAKTYAAIYAFDIGKIKENYIRLRLNNWPSTDIAIENNIANKTITPETIQGFGSSTKGLPGIEYLLFSESSENTNDKIKTNPKRANYLKFITNELHENAKIQVDLWETYSDYLIENKESDTKASFNLIFNGLNNVIHFARETKIGKPAGLLKSYTSVNIQILQAHLSKTSLSLIKENVLSVEGVFFNENIISVADKIEYVTKNKILTDKLKSQFKSVITAIDAINSPFVESLSTEKSKVQKLYEELKKLEVLFNVDVKSTLSLIITGTDGDGD